MRPAEGVASLRMSMRLRAGIVFVPLLVAVACTGGGPARSYVSVLPHHAGVIYHDASGWVIRVPAGWHVLPFRSATDGASAAGVQLSNVKLPAPSIVPSFPIQANDKVLPTSGISLIIAKEHDPKLCRPSTGPVSCQRSYATLPLPRPYTTQWSVASQPTAGPLFSDLWFKGGGQRFIATIKIGAKVFNDSHLAVLAKIVTSLHFGRT
jgi:hypothetical protein